MTTKSYERQGIQFVSFTIAKKIIKMGYYHPDLDVPNSHFSKFYRISKGNIKMSLLYLKLQVILIILQTTSLTIYLRQGVLSMYHEGRQCFRKGLQKLVVRVINKLISLSQGPSYCRNNRSIAFTLLIFAKVRSISNLCVNMVRDTP